MNDNTSRWIELGRTTLTSSTTGNSNILNFTVNTSWDFINYEKWPKGVLDYSFEKKYTPKWHIILGYKNQIETMWD